VKNGHEIFLRTRVQRLINEWKQQRHEEALTHLEPASKGPSAPEMSLDDANRRPPSTSPDLGQAPHDAQQEPSLQDLENLGSDWLLYIKSTAGLRMKRQTNNAMAQKIRENPKARDLAVLVLEYKQAFRLISGLTSIVQILPAVAVK